MKIDDLIIACTNFDFDKTSVQVYLDKNGDTKYFDTIRNLYHTDFKLSRCEVEWFRCCEDENRLNVMIKGDGYE